MPSPKHKPPIPDELKQRSRQLRRDQTDAEKAMWRLLRDRQLNGAKFRRQHIVGNFILDFYCHEAKLAIELDGDQHDDPAQKAHDDDRTQASGKEGICVLRFCNEPQSSPEEARLRRRRPRHHHPHRRHRHVARQLRANPAADVGVHLTLTSEWDGYRWGPISTRDAASGLMDDEGFFPRSTPAIQHNSDPDCVQHELFAQVQRAIDTGIVPTHADTHMGSVFHPKHLPAYIKLATHYKMPVMIPRLDERGLRNWGYEGETLRWALKALQQLEDDGLPLVDDVIGMPLDKPEHRLEQVFAALNAIKPGITHFVIHPSHDTPEARAIGPDLPSHIGDYEAFMDERVRQHIHKAGIQVIGYRRLKALMQ